MSFFKFSKAQSRGFKVLIFLIILFFTIQFLVKQFYLSDVTPVYHLPSIKSNYSILDGINQKPVFNSKSNVSFKVQRFNPNQASSNELIALGIKPCFVKRILKYREKGGKFKIKNDLLKIYGFPKDVFDQLAEYITLPNTIIVSNVEKYKSFEKSEKKEFVNLNLTDSLTLEKLPGLGLVLSSRIIKYRNKLGGFLNKEQLKEVYGISEETYLKIHHRCEIDSNQIIKIQINKVTIKELGAHPYIGYKNAKLIIAYRNQHGVFNSIKELIKVKELDMEKINKVIPYLNFL